jgi:hypothetical protein
MGKESKTTKRLGNIIELINTEIIGEDDIGYVYTHLAQCFFPRRGILQKDYVSKHRSLILSIEAGKVFDGFDLVQMDVPSGPKARLLSMYVNTQAKKYGSPHIDLGDSLNDFLKKMGVPVGGKNYKSIVREIKNFSSAKMTFGGFEGDSPVTKYANVMDEFQLWKKIHEDQLAFWPNQATLSDAYMKIITEDKRQMPVDNRVISAIQSSSLALDWYTLLCLRLPQLKRPTKIKWLDFYKEFAPEYSEVRYFRRDLREANKKVMALWPRARVDMDDKDYFVWHPSPPSVPKGVYVPKVIPLKKPKGAPPEINKEFEYDPADYAYAERGVSLRLLISEQGRRNAKKINQAAKVPWDFDVLVSEFVDFNKDKKIETVDGFFVGFVKNKVKQAP